MKDSLFLEGIKKMEAAFRCAIISKESTDIYFARLKYISDEAWNQAVEDIIDNNNRFPSIAEIKSMASYYMRPAEQDSLAEIRRLQAEMES